jgi:hypothetical protein
MEQIENPEDHLGETAKEKKEPFRLEAMFGIILLHLVFCIAAIIIVHGSMVMVLVIIVPASGYVQTNNSFSSY